MLVHEVAMLTPSHILKIAAPTIVLAIALGATSPIALYAQSQQPAQQPAQQPDQQQPDSGGPSNDQGPIVVPKKKAQPEDNTPPPAAPAEPKIKNPQGMPPVTFNVNVPEVTVDVGVLLEKTHQFVPGLRPANFRVYEDGQEQKVIGFKRVEAPITALMICEFAATNYYNIYDMRNSAFSFVSQLRPQDYVALMTFDLRTQIVTDFTQDKRELMQDVNQLRIPGFSERNLFDALYEGLDRVTRIDGQKYIIVIASGRDTFSKITLDKMLDKIRKTPDVTIFTISTGGLVRAMTEGRGGFNQQLRDMDNLQADNQMRTFAKMTGGMSFQPRFVTETPDDFKVINEAIRSKYELIYHPINDKQDGTYRHIRVELVDEEGHPLKMQDEKHKPLKYALVVRDGYRAKQTVE
ncbi:MAG TPA: VWA domain-containing protein [Acidobacteriaceae bacterium]|jgi:VWFA-related protein|nr:VWA domain-containing protein [Acidobacteriaceae bacterium]